MQITLHIAKFNNIIFIVLIVKFNLVLNFFIEFWELPYLASDLFQAGKKITVVTNYNYCHLNYKFNQFEWNKMSFGAFYVLNEKTPKIQFNTENQDPSSKFALIDKFALH